MNPKFIKPWNVTGRTWIEVSVPGPWAVENTPSGDNIWKIINTETGASKKIGRISMRGTNYFDKAVEEANTRNLALQKKENAQLESREYVIRYVITIPCVDGIGRMMIHPSQGRYTYATLDEAQAWITSYLANNSEATLQQYGKDVQARACKCYPGHFDPMEIYFDMPSVEDILKETVKVG